MIERACIRMLLICVLSFPMGVASAQDDVVNRYLNVYPVGDSPILRLISPAVSEETILFEAKPIVRYSFYNNIYQRLRDNHPTGQAIFLSYRPHFRMYTDNSRPVKMPSSRIGLAFQFVQRSDSDNLRTLSIEHGHYSNGQSGCTFLEGAEDGSTACDSVYATLAADSDLSKLLNRRNGDFSTNFTKVLLNWRLNRLDDARPDSILSITLGWEWYHNPLLIIFDIGGYDPRDIGIYGRHRLSLQAEYERPGRSFPIVRWIPLLRALPRASLLGSYERILAADDRVNANRVVGQFTGYIGRIGIALGFVYGHDDYNIRLVDSSLQAYIGVTWKIFPSFNLRQQDFPDF